LKKNKILGWAVRFVPHNKQRYDTLGDYQEKDGSIIFTITDTGDWKKNSLLAIHEIFEKILNKHMGITDKQVDEWDFNFKGDEPGDDPNCIYYSQHKFATMIEMLMAKQLEVNWKKYEDILIK
jgi:hypothetical protein